jgi:hypothetical protein
VNTRPNTPDQQLHGKRLHDIAREEPVTSQSLSKTAVLCQDDPVMLWL